MQYTGMDYSPLFESAELPNVSLKNRLVMAPMTTISGEEDGSFSKQEINYLAQRAADGIGMIMTPACYVHKTGHSFERQVGCHIDEMIPSLTAAAEAINQHGAASILQIHHGGNAAHKAFSGSQPIAPSAIKNRSGTSELPRAMSEDEIYLLIDSFAQAALRARTAGFTGVEIHGANTYLFQQFFSRFTNRRKDRWGSDVELPAMDTLENRSRFAREVIKAVRAKVGKDYLISYRISPEEAEPFGYSTADAIELLKTLIPCGIDVIHVSSWKYHDNLRNDIPSGINPTAMIKAAFPGTPVIGVGGIMLPEQALEVREQGIDFVAMGTVLILEKNWVGKVRAGDSATIRTGISSEIERQSLDIPDRMKEYTRRFLTVD